MIKIKYNSPAIPQEPYNFSLGTIYECDNGKKKNTCVVKGSNIEKEFSLEFIKSIFKPCDGYGWDMLEEKVIKENTIKKHSKSVKSDK